jgi:hypothetical protein
MATTAADVPTITYTEPNDPWTVRRYFVDGREVSRVSAGDARAWRCSPNHPHGPFGGMSWTHLGDHVDGCGWVAVKTEWAVYLSGSHSGPHYHQNIDDAFAAAERIAESARLCSRPVSARLCRLLKRHDGPCVPWS